MFGGILYKIFDTFRILSAPIIDTIYSTILEAVREWSYLLQ